MGTWEHTTKAYIRKLLKHSVVDFECSVCWETIEQFKASVCPKCSCKECSVCRMKKALTAKAIKHIKSNNSDFTVEVRCAGCRVKSYYDLRTDCPRVMDRLSEFNPQQQSALKYIKQKDP